MNLLNFKNNAQFNSLRDRMRAEYRELVNENEWEAREAREIEIKIEQGTYAVKNLDEITVDRDGVLRHNGKAVIVYIPDNDTYKYHIADCTALRSMKSKGRYDRYILTRRTDGKFKILPRYRKEYFAPLKICKYCLGEIGYSRDERSVRNFNIAGFFNERNKGIQTSIKKPKYTDLNAPVNSYTNDFNTISAKIKEKRGYTCELCKVNLSFGGAKRFLHTHHVNGRKEDNKETNLKVLCVACHALQPGHAHMKIRDDYKQFVAMYNVAS